MQAMEERYKKYIEKAKSVIKTLDPKQNPNAVPEVSALRKQLTEKDVLIEALEQVSNRSNKEPLNSIWKNIPVMNDTCRSITSSFSGTARL